MSPVYHQMTPPILWQSSIDERRGYLPHFSSLVALRFFAAAAIIFAHTLGYLILQVKYLNEWGFPSLMVFFHILSGFTLAYVYPKFDSRMMALRFWKARVGRIWPVHILMIVVIILFFQRDRVFDGLWWCQLFSNVTLTQSWLPSGRVAEAFNGPAWSLSSEFGLYLFFPFLIHKWNQTWHFKLLACVGLSVGFVSYCNYCQYHDTSLLSRLRIDPKDLIYIHPFARMFEFCLGMAMALFWEKSRRRHHLGAVTGTLLEVGAIALCVATMLHAGAVTAALKAIFHLSPFLTRWFERMLIPIVPFALLIFVFSMNGGKISSLLGFPVFVFLGELSFSLYLVHVPLIRAFISGVHDRFDFLPRWATLAAFWCCTLISAHIIFQIWEQPARNFFRRLLPLSNAKVNIAGSLDSHNAACGDSRMRNRPGIWILPAFELIMVASLLSLVIYDGLLRPHIQLIDAKTADQMVEEGLPGVRNLKFGEHFILKALVPHWSNKGLEIDLAWQSLCDQPLDYVQAVHFVDKEGNLMGGADHPQEANHVRVGRDTMWMDKLTFANAQLIGVSYLGLGIYRPGENLLPVSGGVVDWNGGRLLVSFASELAAPDTLAWNHSHGLNISQQVDSNKDSAEGE